MSVTILYCIFHRDYQLARAAVPFVASPLHHVKKNLDTYFSFEPKRFFARMKRPNAASTKFISPSWPKKTVLILGSSGVLGSTVVQTLKKENCKVIGADIVPPEEGTAVLNERYNDRNRFYPDAFIPLSTGDRTVQNMIKTLCKGLEQTLDSTSSESDTENKSWVDAIICTNGGFIMDNAPKSDIDGSVYEQMLQMNFFPIVAAGEIAKKYMTLDQGLFVVIGSTAALNVTPTMAAYGCSKAAAHHYVQTLGSLTGETLSGQSKGRRKSNECFSIRAENAYLMELTTVGILPTTLDTPMNRDAMPNEDFAKWTKPIDIATEISSWLKVPELRPHSGSLVKVVTKRNFQGDWVSEFHLVR